MSKKNKFMEYVTPINILAVLIILAGLGGEFFLITKNLSSSLDIFSVPVPKFFASCATGAALIKYGKDIAKWRKSKFKNSPPPPPAQPGPR